MIAIIDGDVLLYMSIWKTDSLEESKENFSKLLEEVLESLFTEKYVMAIGGPDNFRLDLFPDYKGNRTKAKKERAEWFYKLKSWVSTLEGVVESDNCEADDLIRIWSLECDKADIPRCVVSVDKDLDCISGLHYNPRNKSIYEVSEEYAERFYWQQVLTGDSVDFIPGLWKVGPAKAKKILESAYTRRELEEAVCRAYYKAHPEDGYERMITNGRLIHLWRYIGDYFKVEREVYESAITK